MMFARVLISEEEKSEFQARLDSNSPDQSASVSAIVSEILAKIRGSSDREHDVLQFVRQFDARDCSDIFITDEELQAAEVEPDALEAIQFSIARVRRFHEAQLRALTSGWTQLGVGYEWKISGSEADEAGSEGQRLIPIKNIGIYAPGGKATYPSSVIMNVIPAVVAGAENVLLSTPPRRDGSIAPAVLVAARECGVKTILKAGGAYALAAMAYGIPGKLARRDAIAGPGNVFVNEAKRQLFGTVGLDGYAGPSEVAVVVDETANVDYAAADLLTQIEHAEDNVGTLICTSEEILEKVETAIESQLKGAPREAIMRAALKNYGTAIVAETTNEIVDWLDAIAPEHAALLVENPRELAERISNCGCLMMGPWSAQSAGDFCAGPSHTLPTGGATRFSSPVNVMHFMKFSSMTYLSRADLDQLIPTIEEFADLEGFPAHGNDATIRRGRL